MQGDGSFAHEQVDELRYELLGVLMGSVDVVAPRDDEGEVGARGVGGGRGSRWVGWWRVCVWKKNGNKFLEGTHMAGGCARAKMGPGLGTWLLVTRRTYNKV